MALVKYGVSLFFCNMHNVCTLSDFLSIRNNLIICILFCLDTLSKTSTPFNKSNKAGSQQGTPWETLVVFAMNLKQLNVQMNMSNVMGNTT